MRIVVIEQFYYPEGWGGAQLPRDVTIDLARAALDTRATARAARMLDTRPLAPARHARAGHGEWSLVVDEGPASRAGRAHGWAGARLGA